MNAAEMLKRTTGVSPRLKARIAGAIFLLSLLAAVLGEFVFRSWEIVGDLIAVTGMVAVTLLLYATFRPVNRGVALLAASINFVGLACGALRWNPQGVDLPVVLNGFYCFLIGYLIFRSTFLPRFLGALMALAGLGWVTYLSPPLAAHLSPYNLALSLFGEGLLMLWLLVMGVNAQKWQKQAGTQAVNPA
jgi:Domain of unknown function (DUF4386)